MEGRAAFNHPPNASKGSVRWWVIVALLVYIVFQVTISSRANNVAENIEQATQSVQ